MLLIYSGQNKEIKGKSVFLAGPSPRSGQTLNWRKETVKMFEDFKFTGTLIIPEPEFGNWDNYDNVVEWEDKYMSISDIILFWVPRSIVDKHYGFTTNVEFGRWLYSNKKVIYGRPDWADQSRYLDFCYTKITGENPCKDLSTLVKQVVRFM